MEHMKVGVNVTLKGTFDTENKTANVKSSYAPGTIEPLPQPSVTIVDNKGDIYLTHMNKHGDWTKFTHIDFFLSPDSNVVDQKGNACVVAWPADASQAIDVVKASAAQFEPARYHNGALRLNDKDDDSSNWNYTLHPTIDGTIINLDPSIVNR